MSHLRILVFHLRREGSPLQSLDLSSALRQEFLSLHASLPWNGTSVFAVSSEDPVSIWSPFKTSKGYSAETDKSTNIRSVFDRPALTSIKSLCIVLYKYFDISYPNLHLQSLDKKYQKFIILSVFVYQIISINFWRKQNPCW